MRPGTRQSLTDIGLLLIRLIVGVVFVFHGSQKLFGLFGGGGLSQMTEALQGMNVPYPQTAAVLAGCAEFFGGLSLILGLWMRLLILPTIFTMFVAVTKVHAEAFSAQHNGMEYALTLGVVMLGLVFTGPGRIALTGRPRCVCMTDEPPADSTTGT